MPEYDAGFSVVKRDALYQKVWDILSAIAETAAPGSITPETFAHVSVDVVLTELLRMKAILPSWR